MSNTPEKIPLEQQQQQPSANPLYPTLNQDAANPLLPPQAAPAYPAAPATTGPPPPPGYMPVPQMNGMPIMTQPGMPMQPVLGQQQVASWMPMPQGIPNCPPGLEYLTAVDQLLVHQQVELLEAFTGFEMANKYTVKNTFGQNVYWAVEDTTCCTRMCCGPDRPFDIKILDNYQNEVLHLRRDLRCKSCCFPCCLQKLEVSAPPGNVIGTVVQKWSLCRPVFDIRDRNNETVLTIRGPICQCTLCGDVKFTVFSKDGTEVGKVTKQWTGFVQEHFTDADNFGINFPMDLDVRVKATMLGALFLIDYMYFESGNNKKIRR
ncbi:phospholipid scramblase 2-like isoform X1 [Anopheles maculipalpis]|uniref:phospholipid scramblase 2-like isoform X1 n=2 Tax=Anopheles maculipalpis TaxID=1496333 RepID=UPI002159B342|nr:phospholipid scramblase 2-like isoform X1 [Anopheles maculipalpis]